MVNNTNGVPNLIWYVQFSELQKENAKFKGLVKAKDLQIVELTQQVQLARKVP